MDWLRTAEAFFLTRLKPGYNPKGVLFGLMENIMEEYTITYSRDELAKAMRRDSKHQEVVNQLRTAIGEDNILGGNINFPVSVKYNGTRTDLEKELAESGLAKLVTISPRAFFK